MKLKKTLQECYDILYTRGYSRELLSDKGTDHSYIQSYESLLKSYTSRPVDFLEIGISYGSCLEMWCEYFHEGSNIYGLDCYDIQKFKDFGTILIGNSTSKEHRDKLFNQKTFDIIIEDGEHIIDTQIETYRNYFPLLKEGGIYVVEDVQNLESDYNAFVSIGASPEAVDLRKIKERHDDAMLIFRK